MNQIDLKGRVAVITGGARGIGFACAQRFIDSGARVALWDLDGDAITAAVASLGAAARGFVVDVANEGGINAARQSTLEAFGQIDIVVNNAGITGPNVKTWEYPPADFRRVVEIDLVAPYLVSRALVPHMIERGYGRIVNIASVAGKEGNPNAPAYSAAKAGLIGLTKSLGKELATSGVLCNCVTPAAAETDIFKQMTEAHIAFMKSKIPMNRFVQVEEIAAMVAWLASEDCSFTTGGVFDISGGRATY
ncbi:MAG TPA: SDR family NAD(P)-dependent oxidoreductase [Casimicrobium huifangae]|jgi:3-oxoacyl-[acyl-carrier protein] reductase|uniref:SDR family NAD(P)-dependent oxidoreductase n=1 Tax=Casimicrobium huifangae TaxID=2591109 RepID=UPI0012EB9DE4|nr:SDR family NAD(P)-dependent oxidoreductase [Casimicrobium huifangae]HQA33173.1 SDR family NAD(P)-dependent oxidoreductase [Casimicrobium huifangae]HQD63641.1 SDR family NAD(P)-dependent oxidoreductase [Casimicrobium huifangae]